MASSAISTDAYLAVCSPLVGVCSIFVGVRCLMSFRQRGSPSVDDALAIAGLIIITATFVVNYFIIKEYYHVSSLQWLERMALNITIIVGFALWTCKAPILILYTKIFTVHKWLLYCCYLTLTISAIWLICAMSPTFMWCPPSATVTETILLKCVKGTRLSGVISGFAATLTDIIIFVVPLQPVFQLHLPMAKKWGLAMVFISGFFGIVASILSLIFKFRAWHGDDSQTLTTMLCTVIECTVALMVGCAPATKAFWSQIVRGHTTGSKIVSSGLSAPVTPGSNRTPKKDNNDEYLLLESQHRSRDGESETTGSRINDHRATAPGTRPSDFGFMTTATAQRTSPS